jgi:voltage-gated potassium channel
MAPDDVPRWLTRLTLAAALLTVPAVIFDEVATAQPWDDLGRALNWAVWAAFAVNLGWTVRRAPSLWAGLRANPLLAGIVFLTWPYLPAGLQVARVLGLLRLVSVAHHARRWLSLDGLRYAALLLAATVLGGGAAFTAIESEQHLSLASGVWWAIVTVTTVGYGDIVPHTEAGRALAVFVMAVGIGTATLVIGAAARSFMQDGDADPSPGLDDLHAEVSALRAEVRELTARLSGTTPPTGGGSFDTPPGSVEEA